MIVGSFKPRRVTALAAASAAIVLAAGAGIAPQDSGTQMGAAQTTRVIVQKRTVADRTPEQAVRQLGGQVTRALPIVAGFAATVPATAVGALAQLPGVRAVTPDSRVRVQQSGPGGSGDIRSVYPKVVNADQAWQRGSPGAG